MWLAHVDSVPVGGSSSPDTVWSGLTEARVSSASVLSWRQRGLLLLHETAWNFSLQLFKTVWSEKPRQAYFSTRECLCRVLWTLMETQRKLNRTFWLQCFAGRPDPPAGSVQKAQFKRANSEELCNLSSWSACCKLLLAVFIYPVLSTSWDLISDKLYPMNEEWMKEKNILLIRSELGQNLKHDVCQFVVIKVKPQVVLS